MRLHAFDGSNEKAAKRFKLFNKPQLQDVVFNRLRQQFAAAGFCRRNPEIKLCLACGRIAKNVERQRLRAHFAANGWELWDEAWFHEALLEMSSGGYENQVSAVVSKLLLRKKMSTEPAT